MEVRTKVISEEAQTELMRLHRAVLPIVYPVAFFERMRTGINVVVALLYKRDSTTNTCTLVAFATARVESRHELPRTKQERFAYIMTLGVHPTMHRMGYGTVALQSLLKQLYDRGVYTAELHVLTSNNKAIGLYRKHGFAVRKLVRHHYQIDGIYSDAFYLSLSMDSDHYQQLGQSDGDPRDYSRPLPQEQAHQDQDGAWTCFYLGPSLNSLLNIWRWRYMLWLSCRAPMPWDTSESSGDRFDDNDNSEYEEARKHVPTESDRLLV